MSAWRNAEPGGSRCPQYAKIAGSNPAALTICRPCMCQPLIRPMVQRTAFLCYRCCEGLLAGAWINRSYRGDAGSSPACRWVGARWGTDVLRQAIAAGDIEFMSNNKQNGPMNTTKDDRQPEPPPSTPAGRKGPYCSFCHGEAHTLGECPACASREAVERALIRANDALRDIAVMAEQYNYVGWQRIVGKMQKRASEALSPNSVINPK